MRHESRHESRQESCCQYSCVTTCFCQDLFKHQHLATSFRIRHQAAAPVTIPHFVGRPGRVDLTGILSTASEMHRQSFAFDRGEFCAAPAPRRGLRVRELLDLVQVRGPSRFLSGPLALTADAKGPPLPWGGVASLPDSSGPRVDLWSA